MAAPPQYTLYIHTWDDVGRTQPTDFRHLRHDAGDHEKQGLVGVDALSPSPTSYLRHVSSLPPFFYPSTLPTSVNIRTALPFIDCTLHKIVTLTPIEGVLV